ncbi:MAG: peroxiredoxin [Zoogloeaceae bacterium]|jgi:peroxiredoxin Q/BCP|nr:peroxiredoxin [Zoogloeaceae bacterium]
MNRSVTTALPATGGTTFSLANARDKILVLYFYPRDNTPGCSTEAQQFRDLYPDFLAAKTEVVGVSRDALKAHENFREKYALPFPLVSDKEEVLCTQFGVIRQKKLYGKEIRSIERSTFILDPHGKILREWRGVKAPGHAAAVLEFVQTL